MRLDRLDMIDGTPIVDIKRYSPGWDSIFSARTSRDTEHPGDRNRASFLRDILFEAENFHGERCVGAALGARMVDHAIHHWGIAKKEPALRVGWGPDGCINDALQAITGATIGQRAVGRERRAGLCADVGGERVAIQASGGVGGGGGFERGTRGGDGGGGVGAHTRGRGDLVFPYEI